MLDGSDNCTAGAGSDSRIHHGYGLAPGCGYDLSYGNGPGYGGETAGEG
jgi:hypothetical protein